MRRLSAWPQLCRALGAAGTLAFSAAAFTPLAERWCELCLVPPRLSPADAIVVLGSGVGSDGALTSSGQRKALAGIELFRKGLAPRLVFLGWEERELEARRALALELGVAPEAILVGSSARTTRDEAERAAELLGRAGARRRVLVVTGRLHMRRAAGLFERSGFEVAPAPIADVYCRDPVPDSRLTLMVMLLRESAALAYYRLAGYL
ncbi:MAG TPA: YdcF family protein [Vicinamibacteria bacterium]|nr:YdcF family protein [Vicinamibacteria bacterium]